MLLPQSKNLFDNIAALAPLKQTKVADELAAYLSTAVEAVQDPVQWWYEHRRTYPNLSCMAISYLTIPGTSSLSRCTVFSACLMMIISNVCRRRMNLQSRAADPATCQQWDVLKFDPRTSVPQRLEQTGPDRE